MSYQPPTVSKPLLDGVPFDEATDTAPEARARYAAFDKTGTKDPNKCKALLKFPSGTIFWSSKMAVDADGFPSARGRPNGPKLDPGAGAPETKFTFNNGDSLSSEAHSYVVLPQGRKKNGKNDGKPFHPDLNIGDVAIVIYKDKITAAVCGDLGPNNKIGEGSIRIHEDFHPPAPDPCKTRDKNDGHCLRILDSSIGEDVLFFVFPGSSLGDTLTPSTIESLVNERAFALFNRLKGLDGLTASDGGKLPNVAKLVANLENSHGSSNPHLKPPVEFIESPHHSSRNGAAITMIVVHCTEIALKETVALFANPNSKRQVSAHYVIGRQGEIIQMVNDSQRANHCKGANSNSIGIEHEGSGTDTMTPEQEASSVALISWLLEQYDIPKKRIFGHDFAPGRQTKTSCPDKLFGAVHSQQQVQEWVQAHV